MVRSEKPCCQCGESGYLSNYMVVTVAGSLGIKQWYHAGCELAAKKAALEKYGAYTTDYGKHVIKEVRGAKGSDQDAGSGSRNVKKKFCTSS